MVKVVALFAGLLCVVSLAHAQAPASPPPAASGLAANPSAPWKPIYENSQTIYYVGVPAAPSAGQSNVAALLEYKIPRVIGGAQVWSIVSRMKVNCGEKRMATVDNTLYAQRMGAGSVVLSQAADDLWHEPQPGSLGEMIWNAACGKK